MYIYIYIAANRRRDAPFARRRRSLRHKAQDSLARNTSIRGKISSGDVVNVAATEKVDLLNEHERISRVIANREPGAVECQRNFAQIHGEDLLVEGGRLLDLAPGFPKFRVEIGSF